VVFLIKCPAGFTGGAFLSQKRRRSQLHCHLAAWAFEICCSKVHFLIILGAENIPGQRLIDIQLIENLHLASAFILFTLSLNSHAFCYGTLRVDVLALFDFPSFT
jgi:hypothetical protein